MIGRKTMYKTVREHAEMTTMDLDWGWGGSIRRFVRRLPISHAHITCCNS